MQILQMFTKLPQLVLLDIILDDLWTDAKRLVRNRLLNFSYKIYLQKFNPTEISKSYF